VMKAEAMSSFAGAANIAVDVPEARRIDVCAGIFTICAAQVWATLHGSPFRLQDPSAMPAAAALQSLLPRQSALAGIGAPIANTAISRATRKLARLKRIPTAYSSKGLRRGVTLRRITEN